MEMSKTPAVDHATAIDAATSTKGDAAFFLLALVLVAALGVGFAVAGIGGLTTVMIALVPVVLLLLVTIAQGK